MRRDAIDVMAREFDENRKPKLSYTESASHTASRDRQRPTRSWLMRNARPSSGGSERRTPISPGAAEAKIKAYEDGKSWWVGHSPAGGVRRRSCPVRQLTVTPYPGKRELELEFGLGTRSCLASFRPAGPMPIPW